MFWLSRAGVGGHSLFEIVGPREGCGYKIRILLTEKRVDLSERNSIDIHEGSRKQKKGLRSRHRKLGYILLKRKVRWEQRTFPCVWKYKVTGHQKSEWSRANRRGEEVEKASRGNCSVLLWSDQRNWAATGGKCEGWGFFGFALFFSGRY